jgi:hypothetical protein
MEIVGLTYENFEERKIRRQRSGGSQFEASPGK